MIDIEKLISGWTLTLDEVSNGVFKITMTDKDGRKAELTDTESQENLDKCIGYAFDIEKQISKNWNKFLFDTVVLRLAEIKPIIADYNDKAFGSWTIGFKNDRIILDGKDGLLTRQSNADNNWKDKWEKDYKLLTFYELKDQIKMILE